MNQSSNLSGSASTMHPEKRKCFLNTCDVVQYVTWCLLQAWMPFYHNCAWTISQCHPVNACLIDFQSLLGHIACMQCIDAAYCYRCSVCVCVCICLVMCVCLSVTVNCAKTIEAVKMLFVLWTRIGPLNHVRWGAWIPLGKGQCCRYCNNVFIQSILTWVLESPSWHKGWSVLSSRASWWSK